MTNVLDRISADFNSRFNRLKEDLEAKKDWKVLNRVLNLKQMSCYDLFAKTNDSLESISYLYSMLVNGLLDDSSLMINVSGSGIFSKLYVVWGNDDAPRVTEDHLNSMLDILEESDRFYDLHKKDLDHGFDHYLFSEYYSFKTKLDQLMLSLASDKIKKSYKSKF